MKARNMKSLRISVVVAMVVAMLTASPGLTPALGQGGSGSVALTRVGRPVQRGRACRRGSRRGPGQDTSLEQRHGCDARRAARGLGCGRHSGPRSHGQGEDSRGEDRRAVPAGAAGLTCRRVRRAELHQAGLCVRRSAQRPGLRVGGVGQLGRPLPRQRTKLVAPRHQREQRHERREPVEFPGGVIVPGACERLGDQGRRDRHRLLH